MLIKFEPVLYKTKKLLAGEEVDEGGTISGKMNVRATGPSNLKIGGRIADIVMLQVATHPAAVEWTINHVHEGARGGVIRRMSKPRCCAACRSQKIGERSYDTCRWAASCATNHLEE